jgi:DNA polymerase III gamma/tau subunit
MKLKCQKCNHIWDYQGKNPYYAYCGHCHTLVSIKKQYPDVKTDDKKVKTKVDIKAIFEEVKKHPPTNEELMKIADKDAQI